MSSSYGLTVSQALTRIMTAERIRNEQDRRAEYRKILGEVARLAYRDGSDEERFKDSKTQR